MLGQQLPAASCSRTGSSPVWSLMGRRPHCRQRVLGRDVSGGRLGRGEKGEEDVRKRKKTILVPGC
jgi:hypothetical protein